MKRSELNKNTNALPAPVKKLLRLVEAGMDMGEAKRIVSAQYSIDIEPYCEAIQAVQEGYSDL